MGAPVICGKCGAASDPVLGCAACLWQQLMEGDEAGPASDDLPEIEGYSISGELGRGGMGVVYRARQEHPAREVALKIVAPGSLRATEERRRFRMEVEAMAAMAHPGILPLYETGEDDHGRPWFTMLLASGGTLAARAGALRGEWRSIAELVISLAEAVQYAHGRGILHRDLKPANVLFDAEDRPCVADFGLAKWADTDAGLTASTMFFLGSPAYMAPEAAAGGAKATTTASDIYGLGTILYELLTGHRPYDQGTAAQILARIVAEPPVPPRRRVADIPRDLAVITEKAMARDPARRYTSAAALAEDLRLWLSHRPITARPVGTMERLLIWARRNPIAALLSLLLFVSIVVAGALLWRANSRLDSSNRDLADRMDFMTRKLPERLAPLGRLDLLDDVFANVAEHYQRSDSRTDASSLARESDFLTNWAQIFRQRGQQLAAVERLRAAMGKAREATAGSRPAADAVRSRIRSGHRLAEALIEAKQYAEAAGILEESAAFAAAHRAPDFAFRTLEADLEMERYFLASGLEKPEEALPRAEAALRMRETFQAELEQPPATPEKVTALKAILENWIILIQTHTRMGHAEELRQRLDGYQALVDRLLVQMPDDAAMRYYSIHRWQLLANGAADDPQRAQEYHTKSENEAMHLLTRDASNVEWRLAAVQAASRLETLHWKAGDEPARLAARRRMAERLEYLYSAGITDVHFLGHIRDRAALCGDKHQGDDWPAARHHYTEAIRVQQRIAKLTLDQEAQTRFEKAAGRISDKVAEHEGPEAAEKWRAEFFPEN